MNNKSKKVTVVQTSDLPIISGYVSGVIAYFVMAILSPDGAERLGNTVEGMAGPFVVMVLASPIAMGLWVYGATTHFSIWYPNGMLSATGGMVGDSDPYWLSDGSFNEKRQDNTVFTGEYRSYFENGNPKDKGAYRNGDRDGDWSCSDETGENTVYATYSKGNLESRTGATDTEQLQDRCRYSACAGAADNINAKPSVAMEDEPGRTQRCPSGVT
jgi:hypothetical protein